MGAEIGHLNEIKRKNVNFKDLVLGKIITSSLFEGYQVFSMELDKTDTKHRADGVRTVTTYPAVIYGKWGSIPNITENPRQRLVIMRPERKDVNESYVVEMAQRSYGDGETSENIAITKVTHPASHKNLGEWVASWKDRVISPYTYPDDLPKNGLPGILIVVYDQSLTMHVRGEDRLTSRIFSSFPAT